ncbi:hypothetical protein FRB99_002504 [Tulasnella sp. 403]|nr:hypothetical protein FRB99_002504 [Tulasnella sp. 403]
MATVDTRPYSKNFSGLETQTILAVVVGSLCLTSFELMRRKRRLTKAYKASLASSEDTGLGSVESWEWGYLYQGRCWAQRPSPPLAKRPLAWVKQMAKFREADLLPLIGPDSTVYARFLRGSFYFVWLHSLTTMVILLPIHLVFSPDNVPHASMTRASISSLVGSEKGKKFLPIHLVLLVWVTLTWSFNLFWIARGAFRYRRQATKQASDKVESDERKARENPVPGVDEETRRRLRGWRLKTVMVTNVPAPLRDEKLLKEYFDFYLARVKDEPPPAPGLVAGLVSFWSRFAQARAAKELEMDRKDNADEEGDHASVVHVEMDHSTGKNSDVIAIEKVVLVRKMTELASLMERRDEVMLKLEEAHIRLARKTLTAVKRWIEERQKGAKSSASFLKRMSKKEALHHAALTQLAKTKGATAECAAHNVDLEQGASPEDVDEEEMMNTLTQALRPYLEDFGMLPKPVTNKPMRLSSPWLYRKLHGGTNPVAHSRESSSGEPEPSDEAVSNPPDSTPVDDGRKELSDRPTIWEVLHTVPRHHLDAFQPLVRLNALFRGEMVPAIDYYTMKLGLLTALIHENRSRPASGFIPASTAFVTFENPHDALKTIKLLPSHPKNPYTCLVTMAPEIGDLDWSRLMTNTFTGEFLKDWVVDLGVWAFTFFWIIPVTFLVSLVSVDSLSTVWPGLKNYLDKNPVKKEIISSLLPTVLVTGLAILVPLILLLISKKAHTIVLLSKLHDQILTRYHKFLVCNVLVFFCVGVSALSTFLASFKQPSSPVQVVAQKFPDAAPFYVGWVIFQTAIHAGLELGLLGLPLLVYPATVLKAATPRKRKLGTRPRTFNFYYWLPNHLVVLYVVFCFSLLNPLIIPFATLYFSVALVVFKHQFLHVYSKAYEMNASVLLIRIIRYSFDGIILSQFIFLALMIIVERTVLAVFSGLFIALTIALKLYMTMYCRANFDIDAKNEAKLICGCAPAPTPAKEGQALDGTTNTHPPVAGSDDEHLIQPQEGADGAQTPTGRMSMGARFGHIFRHSHSHHNHHSHHPHYPFHNSHHHGLHRHASNHQHHGNIRFWTWRLPSGGVQFAYSTLPAPHPSSNPPDPFALQRTLNSSGSPDDTTPTVSDHGAIQNEKEVEPTLPVNPGVVDLAAPKAATYTDPFGAEKGNVHEKGHPASLENQYTTRRPDLVAPHEKRQPWDDAPRYDLTYDNPHYTRPIDNVLWLPINPCTILDLDETVDVFRAITSEPGAGMLGQWVNESAGHGEDLPAEMRNAPPGHVPEGEELEVLEELPLVGTERIALPPAIESRISTETDYEQSEAGPSGVMSTIGAAGSTLLGTVRPQRRKSSSFSFSMASTQAGAPGGGRNFSGNSSIYRVTSRTLRPVPSRVSTKSSTLQPPPSAPSSSAAAAIATANAGVGISPSDDSPLTGSSPSSGPRRLRSMTSAQSRARSGSAAGTSQFSTFGSPLERTVSHHVDLGAQSPFADPNFNIILRSATRLVGDSPGEDIPPEFGGLEMGATPPPSAGVGASTEGGRPRPRRGTTVSGMDVPRDLTVNGTVDRMGRSRGLSVSTREAVVGEVLAEEQIATAERVRRETLDSEQNNAPRSWMTAWLYNTLRHDADDEHTKH